MSDDPTTQPVVDEPKTPAQPGDAGAGARNEGADLDAVIKDYNDSMTRQAPPAPPEQPAGTASQQTLRDPVLTEMERRMFRQDMDALVGKIRGNISADLFDDGIVEAWVDRQARLNPELAMAWSRRSDEPKKFQKFVSALSREFVNKYGKLIPDKNATEDREAVTAAVRGASTQAPTEKPPNFADMSDHEFLQYKAKMIRR